MRIVYERAIFRRLRSCSNVSSPAPQQSIPPSSQVWNKTVRPAPKVGLQGDWKPVDELHAVLVHCDTWTPRFSGLRGNVVPLGPVMAGQDHRAARHFQDGVVTYSELLILEKPPEMSKKKRKKTEDGEDYAANATPHYRMMFSLYRRDSNAPPPPPVPNPDGTMSEPQPDGKHLTFCMAPEDILIRNSFHMLTEGEKDARRAEYKSKQLTPKVRTSGGGGGGGGGGAGGSSYAAGGATAAAAATALAISQTGGSAVDVEAEYPSPAPGMYGSVAAVQGVAALPPLTVEALKSQAGGSDHERIIKLEGISPGMCGGAMALLPDAPLLSALSTTSGAYAGGTSVWIQGSRFNTRTRVYVAGVAVPRIQVVSDGLITLHTPPSAPGIATVEVRATNDGCAWSNALHFTYIASEAGASSSTDNQPSTDDSSPDALALAHRQATLLQSLVNTCCAKGNPASENMVSELMAPELSHTSRMFGASVLLLLSGLQSTAAAEFSRQDANGCTLVHYACSSRNLPALQLLLNSGADATTADATGSTPLDWAARYAWVEGQQALCTATGQPAPTATPAAPMGAASSMPIAVPEAGATVAEAAVPSNGTAVAAGTPPLVAGAVAGAHPSAMRSLGQFIDPAQQQQQQQAGVEGGDGLGLFAAAAASVNSAQPQA